MTFKRAALLLFFVIFAGAAHAQQAPDAAPTGAPATSAPLAAPPGAVNADVTTSFAGFNIPDFGGFSIVSSFLRADIVVKAVMIFLVLASLWSWAIIFNKWIALGALRRKAAKFEKIFW